MKQTPEEFIESLKEDIDENYTASDMARDLSISKSHMSRLLAGKVNPGNNLLAQFGLKRTVIYVDNDCPF